MRVVCPIGIEDIIVDMSWLCPFRQTVSVVLWLRAREVVDSIPGQVALTLFKLMLTAYTHALFIS